MLLQSHDPGATPASLTAVERGEAAVVHLLPALPAALRDGRVRGLRARGGLTVDISWRDGKLSEARVRADQAIPVTMLYGTRRSRFQAEAGRTYVVDPTLARNVLQ
jgi:alpha-L-fucosidase 2